MDKPIAEKVDVAKGKAKDVVTYAADKMQDARMRGAKAVSALKARAAEPGWSAQEALERPQPDEGLEDGPTAEGHMAKELALQRENAREAAQKVEDDARSAADRVTREPRGPSLGLKL